MEDPCRMPEDKPKVLPKKPDEKSHPDPLKRFEALKEWRKVMNKITGEEDVMKWEPKKTIPSAEKELDKAAQDETKAVQEEVEVKKIGKVKKKRTLSEQLAELKRIRKNKKRLKDKEAKEKKKKKKIG